VAASTGSTGDLTARADTAGAVLALAAPATTTTLSVATTAGPLWTTDVDDYPMTLSVGGLPVVATACSGAASPQTFTVAALRYDRAAGVSVQLYDQAPTAL
jgi:hypothetical protein